MSDAPDDKIDAEAATRAIRLAVRLEQAAPVDATPPDPRLAEEARAEADRAATSAMALADVADAAREVGVDATTLRMALLAQQAGGAPPPDGGRVIAFSRRFETAWLTPSRLRDRLGELNLERIAVSDSDDATVQVFRWSASQYTRRRALSGVQATAERLGWPLVLTSVQKLPSGATEVVIRVHLANEAETGRRIPVRATVRALALSAGIGGAATLMGGTISDPGAIVGGVACAGVALIVQLILQMDHRLPYPAAEEALERDLRAFLEGVDSGPRGMPPARRYPPG